ncbi:MAG: mechanosensitive ion channel domain-containing protein [Pseudolysinimonas sp.]|uniref:mechanosensitive ion channel domain-containing protein n=1 Tax=Pseudolysinimonas sp. TaxID=2680009 RepID=UPI003263734B
MFDVINGILAEPWFWPAVAVIVGLPLVLLVLGEVHTSMVRRDNPGQRIVLLIRNVLAPLGAIIILFTQIPSAGGTNDFTWAKIAATAFGFVVILVLLNGLNLAIFVTAKPDTWRSRIPTIFVEIARVLLIVICLAVLFGWIWNADIGGFFTALGVGSIVIGLALQNAVGGVLSGLFLLFEQPFETGDYIVTPEGKGRVVAVNWRATHIDTGNGVLIIPNSNLAGNSFSNLTRATAPWETSADVRFATDDPPQAVIDLMVEVANGLPERHPDGEASAIPMGKSWYEVSIPLTSPGKSYGTLGLFRTRLWYAARRAGLHLDRDLTDNYATPENTREVLLRLAPRFYLSPDDAVTLLDQGVQLERWGEGERLQRAGAVPDGLRIIVSGVVEMSVPGSQGSQVRVTQLQRDDVLGLTALTRQAVGADVVALVDVAVLFIPTAAIDAVVRTRPALARDLGQAIDARQHLGAQALSAVGEKGIGSLVIA